MVISKMLLRALTLAGPLMISGGLSLAQMQDNQERQMKCGNNSHSNRLVSHCEIKEQTLPAMGRLTVDGEQNGGVSVKGWLRNEVVVRAKIQTAAETEAQASSLVNQIRLDTAAGQIRASGPSSTRDQNWSVTYEIFVPQKSDLSVKAHNGGIVITDVWGRIEFDTVNGGVTLKRLAGEVRGETKNGGLTVELAGTRWDGGEFDAKTTNGGITMMVPDNYSARLETSTVNGGIKVDFPVTVQGELKNQLDLNLGSGGALVRAVTTNGGVRIKRI